MSQKSGWILYGATLFLSFLILRAPASLATIASRRAGAAVVLSDCRGTLWNGESTVVWPGGSSRVHWRLKGWTLVVGRIDAKIQCTPPLPADFGPLLSAVGLKTGAETGQFSFAGKIPHGFFL